MGALETLKELVDWILLIPKLIELNAKQRKQIRDVTDDIGHELTRGLILVEQRIEGGTAIATSKEDERQQELQKYISDSQRSLFKSFSEFKVCRGLREKRDQFEQFFHPAKAAIKIENIGKVDLLLTELENDERMIFDEVGSIFKDLGQAADHSSERYVKIAKKSLKQIDKRKTRIKKLTRQVHDNL